MSDWQTALKNEIKRRRAERVIRRWAAAWWAENEAAYLEGMRDVVAYGQAQFTWDESGNLIRVSPFVGRPPSKP